MSLRRITLGFCVAVAACATTPAAADVLIAGSPLDLLWMDDVVAKILATGKIEGDIDTFDTGTGTPSLALLQAYEGVLVFTDAPAMDAALLGDRMADYIDSGGGVVQATFSWHTVIPLAGRWMSDGYSPLTYNVQSQGVELFIGTRHIPGHPVLANVDSFSGGTNSFHNTGVVAAGGTAIADWTNGAPLVAEMTGFNGRIIGLNFYPPSSDARDDFWLASTDGDQLLANGMVYVAGAEPDKIELLAQDTGWYDASGSHTPDNINYLVGDAIGTNTHNFSVFDLSSITDPIVSARLRLFNGVSPPNTEDGYISRDPSETYALYDVTTDIGVLTGGTGGVGAYDDLGGGTFYGSIDVSSADNGFFVVVELNTDAIAALNSAGGKFAFGGTITTISHPIDVQESVFWFSHESPDVRLVLNFSEPCPADLVVNGAVDVKDLLFMLGAWGPCPPKGDCPADLVVDGAVDVKDLLFLLGAWGPCPGGTECEGEVCGGFTGPCGLGQPLDCFCFTIDPAGGGACIMNFLCDDVQPCVDGDCPGGFVCVFDSCCGAAVCVPIISCDNGAAPQGPQTGSGLTGSGRLIEARQSAPTRPGRLDDLKQPMTPAVKGSSASLSGSGMP